ncbi:hypothetical protein NM208_g11645 [Fusarium decemcellulare]|uniref:Uncharacterized protein n=1 Tax=Fusarium decemcellulare TaxID=57161 RepID=A0ACC1RRT5_9HYPO|nr:hypothetical protein NM208_g11645 [Fusarium decemcellulare]
MNLPRNPRQPRPLAQKLLLKADLRRQPTKPMYRIPLSPEKNPVLVKNQQLVLKTSGAKDNDFEILQDPENNRPTEPEPEPEKQDAAADPAVDEATRLRPSESETREEDKIIAGDLEARAEPEAKLEPEPGLETEKLEDNEGDAGLSKKQKKKKKKKQKAKELAALEPSIDPERPKETEASPAEPTEPVVDPVIEPEPKPEAATQPAAETPAEPDNESGSKIENKTLPEVEETVPIIDPDTEAESKPETETQPLISPDSQSAVESTNAEPEVELEVLASKPESESQNISEQETIVPESEIESGEKRLEAEKESDTKPTVEQEITEGSSLQQNIVSAPTDTLDKPDDAVNRETTVETEATAAEPESQALEKDLEDAKPAFSEKDKKKKKGKLQETATPIEAEPAGLARETPAEVSSETPVESSPNPPSDPALEPVTDPVIDSIATDDISAPEVEQTQPADAPEQHVEPTPDTAEPLLDEVKPVADAGPVLEAVEQKSEIIDHTPEPTEPPAASRPLTPQAVERVSHPLEQFTEVVEIAGEQQSSMPIIDDVQLETSPKGDQEPVVEAGPETEVVPVTTAVAEAQAEPANNDNEASVGSSKKEKKKNKKKKKGKGADIDASEEADKPAEVISSLDNMPEETSEPPPPPEAQPAPTESEVEALPVAEPVDEVVALPEWETAHQPSDIDTAIAKTVSDVAEPETTSHAGPQVEKVGTDETSRIQGTPRAADTTLAEEDASKPITEPQEQTMLAPEPVPDADNPREDQKTADKEANRSLDLSKKDKKKRKKKQKGQDSAVDTADGLATAQSAEDSTALQPEAAAPDSSKEVAVPVDEAQPTEPLPATEADTAEEAKSVEPSDNAPSAETIVPAEAVRSFDQTETTDVAESADQTAPIGLEEPALPLQPIERDDEPRRSQPQEIEPETTPTAETSLMGEAAKEAQDEDSMPTTPKKSKKKKKKAKEVGEEQLETEPASAADPTEPLPALVPDLAAGPPEVTEAEAKFEAAPQTVSGDRDQVSSDVVPTSEAVETPADVEQTPPGPASGSPPEVIPETGDEAQLSLEPPHSVSEAGAKPDNTLESSAAEFGPDSITESVPEPSPEASTAADPSQLMQVQTPGDVHEAETSASIEPTQQDESPSKKSKKKKKNKKSGLDTVESLQHVGETSQSTETKEAQDPLLPTVEPASAEGVDVEMKDGQDMVLQTPPKESPESLGETQPPVSEPVQADVPSESMQLDTSPMATDLVNAEVPTEIPSGLQELEQDLGNESISDTRALEDPASSDLPRAEQAELGVKEQTVEDAPTSKKDKKKKKVKSSAADLTSAPEPIEAPEELPESRPSDAKSSIDQAGREFKELPVDPAAQSPAGSVIKPAVEPLEEHLVAPPTQPEAEDQDQDTARPPLSKKEKKKNKKKKGKAVDTQEAEGAEALDFTEPAPEAVHVPTQHVAEEIVPATERSTTEDSVLAAEQTGIETPGPLTEQMAAEHSKDASRSALVANEEHEEPPETTPVEDVGARDIAAQLDPPSDDIHVHAEAVLEPMSDLKTSGSSDQETRLPSLQDSDKSNTNPEQGNESVVPPSIDVQETPVQRVVEAEAQPESLVVRAQEPPVDAESEASNETLSKKDKKNKKKKKQQEVDEVLVQAPQESKDKPASHHGTADPHVQEDVESLKPMANEEPTNIQLEAPVDKSVDASDLRSDGPAELGERDIAAQPVTEAPQNVSLQASSPVPESAPKGVEQNNDNEPEGHTEPLVPLEWSVADLDRGTENLEQVLNASGADSPIDRSQRNRDSLEKVGIVAGSQAAEPQARELEPPKETDAGDAAAQPSMSKKDRKKKKKKQSGPAQETPAPVTEQAPEPLPQPVSLIAAPEQGVPTDIDALPVSSDRSMADIDTIRAAPIEEPSSDEPSRREAREPLESTPSVKQDQEGTSTETKKAKDKKKTKTTASEREPMAEEKFAAASSKTPRSADLAADDIEMESVGQAERSPTGGPADGDEPMLDAPQELVQPDVIGSSDRGLTAESTPELPQTRNSAIETELQAPAAHVVTSSASEQPITPTPAEEPAIATAPLAPISTGQTITSPPIMTTTEKHRSQGSGVKAPEDTKEEPIMESTENLSRSLPSAHEQPVTDTQHQQSKSTPAPGLEAVEVETAKETPESSSEAKSKKKKKSKKASEQASSLQQPTSEVTPEPESRTAQPAVITDPREVSSGIYSITQPPETPKAVEKSVSTPVGKEDRSSLADISAAAAAALGSIALADKASKKKNKGKQKDERDLDDQGKNDSQRGHIAEDETKDEDMTMAMEHRETKPKTMEARKDKSSRMDDDVRGRGSATREAPEVKDVEMEDDFWKPSGEHKDTPRGITLDTRDKDKTTDKKAKSSRTSKESETSKNIATPGKPSKDKHSGRSEEKASDSLARPLASWI